MINIDLQVSTILIISEKTHLCVNMGEFYTFLI